MFVQHFGSCWASQPQAWAAAVSRNSCTYFFLDGMSSCGRLYGVQTGSPTNSRIAYSKAELTQDKT